MTEVERAAAEEALASIRTMVAAFRLGPDREHADVLSELAIRIESAVKLSDGLAAHTAMKEALALMEQVAGPGGSSCPL